MDQVHWSTVDQGKAMAWDDAAHHGRGGRAHQDGKPRHGEAMWEHGWTARVKVSAMRPLAMAKGWLKARVHTVVCLSDGGSTTAMWHGA